MPTVTTIVRGNGREEGELDSGLSQVRPPPPPVPPPNRLVFNKIVFFSPNRVSECESDVGNIHMNIVVTHA